MVLKDHKQLSIRRQSELLNLNRSSLHREVVEKEDSEVCNMISEAYASFPIYGYRRITAILRREGIVINHKKVLRLMQAMNLRAIYPCS